MRGCSRPARHAFQYVKVLRTRVIRSLRKSALVHKEASSDRPRRASAG